MIVTERFVLLNFPKTVSTFARKIIKQLYARYETFPYKMLTKLGLIEKKEEVELLLPALDATRNIEWKNQHEIYM